MLSFPRPLPPIMVLRAGSKGTIAAQFSCCMFTSTPSPATAATTAIASMINHHVDAKGQDIEPQIPDDGSCRAQQVSR